MPSLADTIEAFLLQELARRGDQVLEIQRNELSEQFGCAPSQITYVLETRFTRGRGYLVESRRGGGGYVRIVKVPCDSWVAVQRLLDQVGEAVSEDEGRQIVRRLVDEGLLLSTEEAILYAAIDRETIGVELPLRDRIRARLLRAMISAALAARRAQGRAPRPGESGVA
ncbi:MAG: CtsR family transcriptional regulator [Clostridia bacterium]|nr:CtsR family transcriptional regulator [Clostridia bacterium]